MIPVLKPEQPVIKKIAAGDTVVFSKNETFDNYRKYLFWHCRQEGKPVVGVSAGIFGCKPSPKNLNRMAAIKYIKEGSLTPHYTGVQKWHKEQ
jgi:hypothetical protein